MTTVELPRRAHPQPAVRYVAGGDCGACVLGAATGLAVADAYDRFARQAATSSFSRGDMRQALIDARHGGLLDRLVCEVPAWPYTPLAVGPFGPSRQNLAWFEYVRMALDAGYYGLACVSFTGEGKNADHWVLLCGARSFVAAPDADGCGVVRQELLVSCPARYPAGLWTEHRAFLREQGGYDAFFARPATR